ncbi:MAG: hypothetical protein HQ579_07525, partial [Candidatus Omnitrophica bacterium]|nr:hypothetical protein [Candidatus Omnitrophota bacterium]
MKKRLVFALILIGVTAISSQIIFVREFLTVFYGNELSVGFLLSVWLFGGAMGSFLAAALRKRSLPVSFATFSNIQVLFFFLIPTSLILTRITRIVFKISLGELVSIPTMLAWSFVCLVPTCTLLGFLFVAGCSLYESGEASSSKKIAGTYFLESIGATLGGIVTSLLLIRILSNFEIAFLIAFLNLFSAYLLARACGPNASVRRAILLILMALFVLFSLVGGIKKIDQKALELRWTGADLIKSKDSIYGNVVLAKISDEFVFFSNGLYTIGAPDRVTAEDVVHFPMLMHPDPKHILLIGGGEGEALSEILKYRGTKVTYVELDPLPIKFAKQYLKKQPWYEFDNPRVAVKNTDARHFIQATDLRFDVVIINLPNPYTAQINRFYTLEFFRTLRNVLNEKGIVSFTVLSSQNYISHELGDYLRSLYNTLKANFKDVKIIPGDSAHFLASNTDDLITLDYNRIETSRKQKNIHT